MFSDLISTECVSVWLSHHSCYISDIKDFCWASWLKNCNNQWNWSSNVEDKKEIRNKISTVSRLIEPTPMIIATDMKCIKIIHVKTLINKSVSSKSLTCSSITSIKLSRIFLFSDVIGEIRPFVCRMNILRIFIAFIWNWAEIWKQAVIKILSMPLKTKAVQ